MNTDIHCPECGSYVQEAPPLDSENELDLECGVCDFKFVYKVTDEEIE